MPTYVYKCVKCENEWEVIHKMSEDGPETCPRCQAPKSMIERIIQAVASVLKGGGWYKDGY